MRLAPADYTYWFVREAFEWSVVLQVLWTFDEIPDEAALRDVRARLGRSPLNRRVVRASVPWARPRWERSDVVPELVLDTESIPADAAALWADTELNTTPLDPESGPTWRLRGVTTLDGGFVLSLTALHLVADGQAMVTAAVGAATGPMNDSLSTRSRVPTVVRDATDAAGLVGSVLVGAVRAARSSFTSGGPEQPAAPPTARTPMHERAPLATPAWATVTVGTEHWAEVAAAHGGTANTLFVAVIAGALRRSGYTGPLKVGIPVSHRADGEEGGNNTAGVSVVLSDEPTPGGDLKGVRASCKNAFAALSAGRRPAIIHLQSLMWLLPLSLVVRVASSGSGMPDAVVSNLGTFPPELSSIAGSTATGVAFRGVAQGVDPAQPHRFGDGLQSWLIESGGATTFAVAAFDEKHFGSNDYLSRTLATELSAWGIRHRVW